MRLIKKCATCEHLSTIYFKMHHTTALPFVISLYYHTLPFVISLYYHTLPFVITLVFLMKCYKIINVSSQYFLSEGGND